MKRLIMKSLVVLVLIAGIGNYLVYLNTGQMPVLAIRDHLAGKSLGDFLPSVSVDQLATEARSAAGKVVDQFSTAEPDTKVKVYKWTDSEGRVHFSDKPLVQEAQQIAVDTRNAISAPEKSSPTIPKAAATQPAAEPSPLEKARAAAEAMNNRTAQQEQDY